jgi:regulatory protein YycI of two-component signal transduction system YycFG
MTHGRIFIATLLVLNVLFGVAYLNQPKSVPPDDGAYDERPEDEIRWSLEDDTDKNPE